MNEEEARAILVARMEENAPLKASRGIPGCAAGLLSFAVELVTITGEPVKNENAILFQHSDGSPCGLRKCRGA